MWANNARHDYFPAPTVDSFYTGATDSEDYVDRHDGYYAWEWGLALFVVLDPYWYALAKAKEDSEWQWTLGKEQYDWLVQAVARDASFKFVFLHNLVGGLNNDRGTGRGGALYAGDWEWGGYNPRDSIEEFDSYRPGWGDPIHDVLVASDVDIVFHGHDHVYVKELHADGIIYQSVPQPSVLGDDATEAVRRAEFSGYDAASGLILPSAGFLNVTVTDSQATVSYLHTVEGCTAASNCVEELHSYTHQ